MKAKNNPQPLTWLGRPWQNRAWLHPLVGAGTVFASGQALDGLEFPDHMGLAARIGVTAAAPVIGGIAGVLAAAGDRYAGAARAYCGLCGLGAGSWLAATALTSPYAPAALVAAGAGALLSFVTYPGVRQTQLDWEQRYRYWRTKTEATTTDMVSVIDDRDPETVRWENTFAKIKAPGLRFVRREPMACGFKVLVRLPQDGSINFQQLGNQLVNRLEIATGMPDGSITVETHVNLNGRAIAREAWLLFDVEDVLSRIQEMPNDHTPLSINDAFVVGKYVDGTPITLKLREVATLIVGVRGRGKTNLLNVIIHQLSRCVDVVLFAVDLKGGRAVKPWLQPWVDGKTHRPIFDWVATTRHEAHLMLVALSALIEQRGRVAAGGTKITPSRELPAVIMLCDEVASLVGARSGPRSSHDGNGETSYTLANMLTTIIQLGRSEAVDVVLATQRATVTMIGNGDLKSQCELRLGLGVTNAQDARSIFERPGSIAGRTLVRLRDRATRGAVLVEGPESTRVIPGKLYFMGDDNTLLRSVYDAVIAHSNYICAVDKVGQHAMEAAVRRATDGQHGYADRWSGERIGHLYGVETVIDADTGIISNAITSNTQRSASSTTSADGRGSGSQRNGFFSWKPGQSSVNTTSARVPAARDPEPQPSTHTKPEQEPDGDRGEIAEETVDATWNSIVSLWNSEGFSIIDRYECMLAALGEFSETGALADEIYQKMIEHGTAWAARTSIYPALKRALAEGDAIQPDGKKGRYFPTAHGGSDT